MQCDVWDENPCTHPQHNPPRHRVYRPGEHKHRCPGCGEVVTFRVPRVFSTTGRLSELPNLSAP